MEIRVPAMGESVSEATVGRWFRQPGEAVAADEPLVELETDKVTLEVNAPAAGVLSAVAARPGDTVSIGAVLGAIAEGATATPAAATAHQAGAATAAAAPAAQPERPSSPAATAEAASLSPAVRKLMAEHALAPAQVAASGRDGRILKADVLEAVEGAQAAASATRAAAAAAPGAAAVSTGAGGAAAEVLSAVASLPASVTRIARAPTSEPHREERVRMTRLRQTIARRLKDAQNTAAMLTTFNEVDMSAIIGVRTQYKDLFERKHGVKLGFMGFFVAACVNALKEIPVVNAEIDGEDIVYKNSYHIGVAVGSGRGLVVPVIRDADRLSIAGVEKAIADLAARANEGKLAIEEMQGGTFTITNGGVFGSLLSTPILNAPQSGILGMHKIEDRPIAIKGEVKIRPMMYVALTYDHRLIDGREAVTFLVRVKEALEDPRRLVLNL